MTHYAGTMCLVVLCVLVVSSVAVPATALRSGETLRVARATASKQWTCRSNCGRKNPIGNCWCDEGCLQTDDCCTDYNATCIATCQGSCGQKSKFNCWCDRVCKDAGDCCADYDSVCANLRPPLPPPSCNSYCGKQHPYAGCWCDVLCNMERDCCPDYNQTCAPPSPPFSCNNSCGVLHYSKMCWCDGACQLKGDCCQDYTTVCTGDKTSQPPSCARYCGQQPPNSNCWCDSTCAGYRDCCRDYVAECASTQSGGQSSRRRRV